MSETLPPPPPMPPVPPPEPPFSPYESPRLDAAIPVGLSSEEVAEKLKIPAIIMIITATLSLLVTGFNALSSAFVLIFQGKDIQNTQFEMFRQFYDQAGMGEQFDKMMEMFSSPMFMWIGVLTNFILLALYALTLVGAIKMLKVRNYGLVMAACIISCVPCYGSFCCLGMIPGIWGLVLLTKPGFKSAFK